MSQSCSAWLTTRLYVGVILGKRIPDTALVSGLLSLLAFAYTFAVFLLIGEKGTVSGKLVAPGELYCIASAPDGLVLAIVVYKLVMTLVGVPPARTTETWLWS